ncbi:hypothetical protein [Sphingobium fuliginis]|jgi:hypothetical protein|uniref:hypothetical protein n=1 Tax=Sphingobium fuliginis (strain ATCC 27551) TaxID=336203 RepID=UPI0037CC44D2
MNPLERACRALCELEGSIPGATMDGKPLWQDYLPEVRAVIDAIRQPSAAMVRATPEDRNRAIYPEDIWHAMIDAMMGEQP